MTLLATILTAVLALALLCTLVCHVNAEGYEHLFTPEPPRAPVKPPCCLNFPTDKHQESQRKQLREEHYEAPQQYPTAAPVFDVLLFPKCPVTKDDETVCAAVAKLFTKKHTSLYAKSRSYGSEVHLDPLLTFTHDPHRVAKLGKLAKVVKDVPKVTIAPPIFTKNLWRSDLDANIVVVGNGCCFNVYPNVRKGDQLSSVCHNKVLGPSEDLPELFLYSVLTPGDTVFEVAGATFERSVIMGGNWKGTLGPANVATVADATGGPFAGVGLFIGGSTADGGGDIIVDNGTTQLGGLDSSDRLINGFTPISIAAVEKAIEVMSAQVCALSQSIQELEATGVVTINIPAGTVNLNCEANVEPCVVEMTTETFNLLTEFTVSTFSANTIKINVSGALTADFQGTFDITSDVHLVWNLYEAEVIRIGPDGAPFLNSIIAPRAKQILIQRDVEGSVLMGHRGSHLGFEIGTTFSTPPQDVECPEPVPTVAVCDCLCPEKKKERNPYDVE